MDLLNTYPLTIVAICAAVFLVQLIKKLKSPARAGGMPSEEDIWDGFAQLSKKAGVGVAAIKELRQSNNPAHAKLIYAGVMLDNNCNPAHRCLPVSVLNQHSFFCGASGVGKTSRVILPFCQQIIGLPEGHPLVIIDVKGDRLLYHAIRETALARGRTFKWITLMPNDPSYVFSFFTDDIWELGEKQLNELVLDSLSLNYGSDYGRGFYTSTSRAALKAALSQITRPRSFAELATAVTDILVNKIHVPGHIPIGLKDALGLAVSLNWLADYPILNIDHPSVTQTDRDHAVTMQSVLENREVLYVWAPRFSSAISAPSIAKLVLSATVVAARARQRRREPERQTYVFIDEAQHVASAEIKAVLEQARSAGVGVGLACQSVEALNKEGFDFFPFVRDTSFQLYLGVTGGVLAEHLSEVGGTYTYLRRSASEHRGQFGPELSVGLSEEERPRFDANTFAELNAIPGLAIAQVKNTPEASGFPALPDYLQTFHSMSHKRAKELEFKPWPQVPGGGGVFTQPNLGPQPPSKTPPQVQLQNLVIQNQRRKRKRNS